MSGREGRKKRVVGKVEINKEGKEKEKETPACMSEGKTKEREGKKKRDVKNVERNKERKKRNKGIKLRLVCLKFVANKNVWGQVST
jgi:hypothetical protein